MGMAVLCLRFWSRDARFTRGIVPSFGQESAAIIGLTIKLDPSRQAVISEGIGLRLRTRIRTLIVHQLFVQVCASAQLPEHQWYEYLVFFQCLALPSNGGVPIALEFRKFIPYRLYMEYIIDGEECSMCLV